MFIDLAAGGAGALGGAPLLIFNSPAEIMVVVVVAVLLFGGKKIPELAKGLGEGIRNFKSSVKEEEKKPEETTNKPAA